MSITTVVGANTGKTNHVAGAFAYKLYLYLFVGKLDNSVT